MGGDLPQVGGPESAAGELPEAPGHRAGILDESVDQRAAEQHDETAAAGEAAPQGIAQAPGPRGRRAGHGEGRAGPAVQDPFLDLLLDGFLEGGLLVFGTQRPRGLERRGGLVHRLAVGAGHRTGGGGLREGRGAVAALEGGHGAPSLT